MSETERIKIRMRKYYNHNKNFYKNIHLKIEKYLFENLKKGSRKIIREY